ncbi:MAG: hypothetical protein JO223_07470 [Hyphomicrobiales bacterium]|nr:hypothetical protein [Hyphomicrobiales bacterium]
MGTIKRYHSIEAEITFCVRGVISPLLANVFLHYVFDLWIHRWRKQAYGCVSVVRYADDFVTAFESEADARKMLADLTERLAEFGLALHEEKTRLIMFGKYAAERRQGAA